MASKSESQQALLALLLLGLPLLLGVILLMCQTPPLEAAGALVLLIFPTIYCYCSSRRSSSYIFWTSSSSHSMDETLPLLRQNSTGLPLAMKFRYRDLSKATRSFTQVVGVGTFGVVHQGVLPDGTAVAVKCLRAGGSAFEEEVAAVLGLSHDNVVALLGTCTERPHRILVYEFMPNGSLDHWIFSRVSSRRRKLGWGLRLAVAVDGARALEYLHGKAMLHLDVKPENILLDVAFRAKLSDLGLAKSLSAGEAPGQPPRSRYVTAHLRGTPGYMAPEWQNQLGVTPKSDVFSFGIVLLELVCGRRCVDASQGEEKWYLPSVAFAAARKGRFSELLDPALERPPDKAARAQVMRLIKVALACVQWRPALRPTMATVVSMLAGTSDSDSESGAAASASASSPSASPRLLAKSPSKPPLSPNPPPPPPPMIPHVAHDLV